MKIELKNIKHSPSLSEETEAFTASLYIDGKHAAYVKNTGHGGPTDCQAVDEAGRRLIKDAEAYCKTLPPITYPASPGMNAFSMDMDLEGFIDDLLTKHLQEKENVKFERKITRAMEIGIVYGIPNQSASVVAFQVPLLQLLQRPNGAANIKNTIIKSVVPNLQPGEKILNDNIPDHILKDAGLSADQYTPYRKQEQKTKPIKRTGRKI